MQRTKVRAKRSNAHLGHLFPDAKFADRTKLCRGLGAGFHFIRPKT
ncbi:MAG: hypothetical protein DME33_02450 [Verrucomicrobia bacterium]|nr:MAG: hypothetical protein DME33_02450 [Verrucomicrobiota bacterium]